MIDKGLTRPVLKAMLLAVLGAGVAGCTDIILPEPSPAQSVAPGTLSGRVVRVADGDTLTVLSGAREEKVRLLGIDTPELAHGANPAECGGAEARAALTLAVMGHRVQVVPDERADSRDRFGRLLGYVQTAAGDAGLALIEQGLASAWRPKSAPTPTRWETYRSAQRKAQAEKVGNWAACGSVGRLQR